MGGSNIKSLIFGLTPIRRITVAQSHSDCILVNLSVRLNREELALLRDDTGTVQLGGGAQPQVSGSGAPLKELTKKLATPNSPSTVRRSCTVHNLYHAII
jgi:hypothetical protein